ncbi:hypothetical protein ACFY4C_22910 [Actinomadura viridis]|uniref:hypothetical protein n=1 Tax=Actinomadura viridis TaxID=58110 RepID=UPI00368C4689
MMAERTPMPGADEAAHRGRVVEGLIDLAAFLEANPGVPVPRFGWRLLVALGVSVNGTTDLAQRAEIDRVAGLLGAPVSDETRDGGHYIARRHFGPVTYEAVHVPACRMATFDALRSYADNVKPDLKHDIEPDVKPGFEGEAA